MKMITNRSYSELIKIDSFEDRLLYLQLESVVGRETFGSKRYLNQMLYKLPEWKRVRREVILRDDGYDLAHPDYPIGGQIYVHHIEPITEDDIIKRRAKVLSMENLISCSFNTHQAIHYMKPIDVTLSSYKPRSQHDTCPWRSL